MFIELIATEFKWGVSPSSATIKTYITNFLTARNILPSKIEIQSTDLGKYVIAFKPSAKGKLFHASVPNKIMLKPGDKRITEDKNFLLSDNLTSDQMRSVGIILTKGLEDIGVMSELRLYEHDEDRMSFISINSSNADKLRLLQRTYPEKGA